MSSETQLEAINQLRLQLNDHICGFMAETGLSPAEAQSMLLVHILTELRVLTEVLRERDE